MNYFRYENFFMPKISEKVVVTAKEFLSEKNINDNANLNEPIYQAKLQEFDWDGQFNAASVFCEVVWKISIGRDSLSEWRQLDKLFSPSPIATHANFRGCRAYKTGNVPEKGALVFWKRGNSWQGHMAIVSDVSADKESFDIIEGRVLTGSETAGNFLKVEERKEKKVSLPFRNDKLNILGFVYPKDKDI
mgnify:CR=1 FL=1